MAGQSPSPSPSKRGWSILHKTRSGVIASNCQQAIMEKLTVLAGSTVYLEYKPCGGISWDLWSIVWSIVWTSIGRKWGGVHCSPPEGHRGGWSLGHRTRSEVIAYCQGNMDNYCIKEITKYLDVCASPLASFL